MTYEELLKELVLRDDRVVVMTAENRALVRNLPPVIGDRFIDTGITEQCMVGAAAGLALRGRIPVVHALATFLTMRAFEFIRTDVGIPGLPVKLMGFVPGFLSDGNGPTHQAIEDIALMCGIPGMRVFAPADHEDLVMMLPEIVEDPWPAYVRLNVRPAVVQHQSGFSPGTCEVMYEGKDILLLTYGMLLEQTVPAREQLINKGYSVGLINIRSIKPMDEITLVKAISQHTWTVVIEDHFRQGGLYSRLVDVLFRRKQMANLVSLALEENWYRPGTLNEVLEYEAFTPEHLAKRIVRHIEQV